MYNIRQAAKYSGHCIEFFTKRKFNHIHRCNIKSHYIEVFISDDIKYLIRISNHANLTVLSDKLVPNFNIVNSADFYSMKKYFKRVYGYGDNNIIYRKDRKRDDTRETINI